MKTRERIYHSVLFEVVALTLIISGTLLFTDESPTLIGSLGFTLPMIAMGWNYVYNLGFDHLYGTNRISRTLTIRVVHSLGFEGGLLILTIPIFMWVFSIGFIEAFILDIGVACFFLIYATIFNFLYDHIRARLFPQITPA